MSRLLTRKEIIDIMSENTKYHEYYCCPDCRDILSITLYGLLICKNEQCLNKGQFDLQGMKIS